MTKSDKFLVLAQALFLCIMLVFWVHFAYLGVLLTNVIQVSQASTLLSSQDLFVVRIVNVVLAQHRSVFEFILNISSTIPLGYCAFGMLAMLHPNKKWQLQNRVHCIVGIGAQSIFLLGLAYMMNNFSTLGRAISIVHTIGWITCIAGLVISAGCVYTLVRLMFDYQSNNSEVPL
ncbi:hypothetical protein AOC36_05580 [Erysipelothrix larvae]|uniref:Uncharacterized protein n=1 Tax=Erysipelothrix larvae TaxID=1514105 RepID=A0A120JTN6_9FIRM|nr:hypothetical protein [Erysipelothrix larvae]AMC93467.1 hypothetical protein AOC36_05580 [Erysipelothrix larvae]